MKRDNMIKLVTDKLELTELFGARDASCSKGKKMYERQRKTGNCLTACIYEKGEIYETLYRNGNALYK